MSQAIKAILFDFDGVILNTEEPIYQSYLPLFHEHGQELSMETYMQCIGSDFNTWSPETHLENLTGQKFDWPSINARRQAWIHAQIEEMDAMPGIRESIDFCHAHQIRLAVASSSFHHWVDRWLKKLGLFDAFETVVCRDDVSRIKPAPDLFNEARARLASETNETLIIEDSYNGLLAGVAANIPVVAIPSLLTSSADFSQACQKLRSAIELPHYLLNY